EGHFHEDRPTGIWKYYCPDGKAFLEQEYPAESLHSEGAPPFQLRSYWDQRGRQRVKEGNGYFEMKMEYDGYNPYSVRFVQRKGRVMHGRPWSEWTLEWIFENGEKEEFAREQYRAKQPEAEPNEW